jgi:hypothetical protein
MFVRRATAIREIESAREILAEWVGKLQAGQTIPVLDGLGNVIGEGRVSEPTESGDVTVEAFIGEEAARSFASELVVVAHKLEGLAST